MIRNFQQKSVCTVDEYEIVRESGEQERWLAPWGQQPYKGFRPFVRWNILKNGVWQCTCYTLKNAKHQVQVRK